MVVANGGGVIIVQTTCDMTGVIESLQNFKHAICHVRLHPALLPSCPAAPKVTLMDRLLRQELTTTTSRAVAGRMDDVPELHEEHTSTKSNVKEDP